MDFGLMYLQNPPQNNESVLSSLISEELPKELVEVIKLSSEVERTEKNRMDARDGFEFGAIKGLGSLSPEQVGLIYNQREAEFHAALKVFQEAKHAYDKYRKSVQN